MNDHSKKRWPVGDLGPDEHTRLCPDCEGAVRRRDEWAGCCPHCGRTLLSLAWRMSRQSTGSSVEKGGDFLSRVEIAERR